MERGKGKGSRIKAYLKYLFSLITSTNITDIANPILIMDKDFLNCYMLFSLDVPSSSSYPLSVGVANLPATFNVAYSSVQDIIILLSLTYSLLLIASKFYHFMFLFLKEQMGVQNICLNKLQSIRM